MSNPNGSREVVEFNDGLQWMMSDEDTYVLGVTQAALDQAGAVDGVDLAEIEDEYDEGDWLGEIRGRNATVELVAPFRLSVLEKNPDLDDQEVLEDDPTGDGWVMRVKKV